MGRQAKIVTQASGVKMTAAAEKAFMRARKHFEAAAKILNNEIDYVAINRSNELNQAHVNMVRAAAEGIKEFEVLFNGYKSKVKMV